MTDTSQPLTLGIDLGGTSVKLGVVRGGDVILEGSVPTAEVAGPDEAFAWLLRFAHEHLPDVGAEYAQVRAVGLAVPGVLDADAAVIREISNLPTWVGVPLRDRLAEKFDRPAAVLNDANAAAYAEFDLRRTRQDDHSDSLSLITLGTGIGCGLVVRSQPHSGHSGCAGELGHLTIDRTTSARPCGCGKSGHLESYAGAAGVVQLARDLSQRSDGRSNLHHHPALTPRKIAEAGRRGDPIAHQVIDQTGDLIGTAVSILGATINPATVLIGGAMTFGGSGTPMGTRFLQAIIHSVRRESLVQVSQNVHIDFAELGNRAGMLGAAAFAASSSET